MKGVPESVLSGYRKIWEGHLEQLSEAREALVEVAWEGMFYREFFPSFDWNTSAREWRVGTGMGWLVHGNRNSWSAPGGSVSSI